VGDDVSRRHAEKVAEEVIDFAAAAYDFLAEISNPAPDLTMRHHLRAKLDAAYDRLTYEDRLMLKRRAMS
jgi:hypothetical protein